MVVGQSSKGRSIHSMENNHIDRLEVALEEVQTIRSQANKQGPGLTTGGWVGEGRERLRS